MTDVNTMRELLRNHVLEITFTKVDGTKRVMLASTNPLYIPEEYLERGEGEETTVVRHNNLTVIDTEIGQWRTIRPDSIVSYVVTDMPVLEQRLENQVAA